MISALSARRRVGNAMPRRKCPSPMPRSVNIPLRWVVRTIAPLKVVAIAFCSPHAIAASSAPAICCCLNRNIAANSRIDSIVRITP